MIRARGRCRRWFRFLQIRDRVDYESGVNARDLWAAIYRRRERANQRELRSAAVKDTLSWGASVEEARRTRLHKPAARWTPLISNAILTDWDMQRALSMLVSIDSAILMVSGDAYVRHVRDYATRILSIYRADNFYFVSSLIQLFSDMSSG